MLKHVRQKRAYATHHAEEVDAKGPLPVRHRDLLARAAAALTRAERGARAGVTEEYLLLDYREALDRLGEITGEVGVDDIYDRIFKNFCIGK